MDVVGRPSSSDVIIRPVRVTTMSVSGEGEVCPDGDGSLSQSTPSRDRKTTAVDVPSLDTTNRVPSRRIATRGSVNVEFVPSRRNGARNTGTGRLGAAT